VSVAVITGAARGIGLATATVLAARGVKVWIGDLDGDLAESEAAALGGEGRHLDVADRALFAEFLDEVAATEGRIDALVNNAGVMPIGAFVEQEQAVIDQTIAVNLLGVINGMQLALPLMADRGRGHVVNIASLTARIPLPGVAVYSGVKSAVVEMTEAVRHELRGEPVRLSCVLPTVVATELSSGAPTGGAGRPITPEQVAGTVDRILRRDRSVTVAVPRGLGGVSRVMRLMPRPMVDGVRRAMGDRRALTDLDGAARAAYETRLARAREQESGTGSAR
jgi:NADP-dependent 3-hydroxy acid dehydrogenase YdfG